MEARAVWDLETEPRKAACNAIAFAVILFLSSLPFVSPQVTQELPEQEDENVVLVGSRIDRSTERIAGIPRGLVDIRLLNCGHD